MKKKTLKLRKLRVVKLAGWRNATEVKPRFCSGIRRIFGVKWFFFLNFFLYFSAVRTPFKTLKAFYEKKPNFYLSDTRMFAQRGWTSAYIVNKLLEILIENTTMLRRAFSSRLVSSRLVSFRLGFPRISVIITRVDLRNLNARWQPREEMAERTSNSPTRRSTSRRGEEKKRKREREEKKRIKRRTKQEFRLKFRNVRPKMRTRGNEWMLQVYCTIVPYTTTPLASALRNVIRPTT